VQFFQDLAPEEILYTPSGEERDVYRVANCMVCVANCISGMSLRRQPNCLLPFFSWLKYSVLTGTTTFPTVAKERDATNMIAYGELSFLDPRWKEKSYGEGQLAEIIPRCWALNPKERPSIGEVVIFLRNAIEKHVEWETRQKRLHRQPKRIPLRHVQAQE
jgi:hypothetical protein